MIGQQELQKRIKFIFGKRYNSTLNELSEKEICRAYKNTPILNQSNNNKITLLKKKLFNDEKIIFTLRNELFNEDIPALSVDEYLEHLGTTDDIEDLFEILIHYTQRY